MWSPVLLFGATLLWVLPLFITNSIGDFKNRNGLAYGFLLGWLGMLVIAVMPSLSPDDGVA